MPYDFNKIAAGYDRMNHIMTLGMDRRWRRKAVREAVSGKSHAQVLDVASGTGDMAVELLRLGHNVTGVDISEEMLEIARKKIASNESYSSSFGSQLSNAENMPFPDASFDSVTCAFGVRNFQHLDQGVAEMSRVLKQGGSMAILEMSTPDSWIVRPFYNLYAHRIIPLLGKLLAGNREAYTYLPTSIQRFPKGQRMLDILNSHGLAARQTKFFFGVCRLYLCIKK